MINHWDRNPCGSDLSLKPSFSKEYYEEIEKKRYEREPEILSFAQFENYRGKRMLEVGVGLGTDFIRWIRSGAEAYGIDFSAESVKRTQELLRTCGLTAKELRVADCESLPYSDDTFDLVYSWGVIHHTPNTQKALSEIFRVVKPGGTCKIMVYHRRSLFALYMWIRHALLKGRPWKSISWCLSHHLESPGTKAFTQQEIRKMLEVLPTKNAVISPVLTYYDKLGHHPKWISGPVGRIAECFGKDRLGWFLTIEFEKK